MTNLRPSLPRLGVTNFLEDMPTVNLHARTNGGRQPGKLNSFCFSLVSASEKAL